MSSPRGEVGLADVLVAWQALGGDDDSRRSVAALLGLRLRSHDDAAAVLPGSGARPAPQVAPAPEVVRRINRNPTRFDRDDEQQAEHRARETGRMPWRRTLRPSGRSLRPGTGPAVAPLSPESPTRAALPLQPLFAPHLVSRIVEAAVATDAGDGLVDVAALVETIAERRPVLALPRSARHSLFRGVQVLVDRHDSMLMFDRDVRVLLAAVRDTVGGILVDVVSFAGSPMRGTGRGPVWKWSAYRPPPRGTPVLVLTDFGLGRPPGQRSTSTFEEWLDLSLLLRRRGSALTALVPFPPHRWPRELSGDMALVQWDRPTTVAAVRRIGASRGG